MKKSEYRSILGQLPIKSPTAEDMARVCPHLTAKEAYEAFTAGHGYVACPPLQIKYGYQVLCYRPEYVLEEKNHPSSLSIAFSGRTRQSYADGKSHGDIFSEHLHMEKAMKFAESNWGTDLIIDSWDSVLDIYVQDPTDLVSDRYHYNYPRTKAVLHIALLRDLNKIVNDRSKPQTILFDEAISQMTLDEIIWRELKGGRGGYTEFNCANCGAGLSLTHCSGCGHQFTDDHLRCGWYTPLSSKMITFLKDNGHVFGVSPEIALQKEKDGWNRKN